MSPICRLRYFALNMEGFFLEVTKAHECEMGIMSTPMLTNQTFGPCPEIQLFSISWLSSSFFSLQVGNAIPGFIFKKEKKKRKLKAFERLERIFFFSVQRAPVSSCLTKHIVFSMAENSSFGKSYVLQKHRLTDLEKICENFCRSFQVLVLLLFPYPEALQHDRAHHNFRALKSADSWNVCSSKMSNGSKSRQWNWKMFGRDGNWTTAVFKLLFWTFAKYVGKKKYQHWRTEGSFLPFCNIVVVL